MRIGDVRRADAAARRTAVVVVVAGAIVGAFAMLAWQRAQPHLNDWIAADPAARLNIVFAVVATATILPIVALGAHLWSLGHRVLHAREFPPPGYRVVRDTPILRDVDAERRGRWLKRSALACAIASVALGLLLWRLARIVPASS